MQDYPEVSRCHSNNGFIANRKLLPLALFLVSLTTECTANINLFVDKNEVRRLTGVRGSAIYYIREGVVNEYAARYVVPVSSNISRLNFHWQNLIRKPMPYEIEIKWNDIQAMHQPKLNISNVGYVSRIEQVFSIFLPCSGQLSALVDVQIVMNISTHVRRRRVTQLHLKRTKTCRRGYNDKEDMYNSRSSVVPRLAAREGAISLLAGVLAAVTVTLAALMAAVLAYIRHRAHSLSVYTSTCSSGSDVFLKRLAKNCHSVDRIVRSASYATVTNLHRLLKSDATSQVLISSGLSNSDENQSRSLLGDKISAHYASSFVPQFSSEEPHYVNHRVNPGSLRSVDDSSSEKSAVMKKSCLPELDSRLISFSERLLDSNNCQLWRGTFRYDPISSSTSSVSSTNCLIKLLSRTRHHQFHEHVEEAARILSSCCDQCFVLAAAGVYVTEAESSDKNNVICLVYSNISVQCTNLKLFLYHQCCVMKDGGGHLLGKTISEQNIVDMTCQVFSALEHLHSKGILHRDVAARNCVVDQKLCVRLTDSAFSSHLFPSEYVTLTDTGSPRPIRWLACESVIRECYAPPTDVWAAAVTGWEIASLCAHLPYAGDVVVDPISLSRALGQGLRLKQPKHCPKTMYEVLYSCWSVPAENRPSAKLVCQQLRQLSASYDRLI